MTVLFVRERGCAPEIAGRFHNVTDDRMSDIGQDRILWRWGSRVEFPVGNLQVNTRESCLLAANKPEVRRLCLTNKIRVPATYFTADEARRYFNLNTAPLLWRPSSHRSGQGIIVVSNAAQVTQQGGYWSQIIPKTQEFRVYVFFGRVIGIDEKIVPDPTQLAWNHAKGGRFEVVHWDKWPSVICWLSTVLVHAIGLHFGAVDLIKHEHRYYVLEVNTSPAMTSVYKLGLLQRSVSWLDDVTTEGHGLPEIAAPLREPVKGYRNYIHPLHNTGRGGQNVV